MEIDNGEQRNRCRRVCTIRTANLNLGPNAIARLLRNMCVPMSKLKFVLLWTILAVLCSVKRQALPNYMSATISGASRKERRKR